MTLWWSTVCGGDRGHTAPCLHLIWLCGVTVTLLTSVYCHTLKWTTCVSSVLSTSVSVAVYSQLCSSHLLLPARGLWCLQQGGATQQCGRLDNSCSAYSCDICDGPGLLLRGWFACVCSAGVIWCVLADELEPWPYLTAGYGLEEHPGIPTLTFLRQFRIYLNLFM